MSQQQFNGPPATFVNAKRVKSGEQDQKGNDKVVVTFGLTKDRQGNEVNTCDQLIDALEQYRGKQVNLDFRIGEAQDQNGRTFPTAYVRIVEMIPKNDPRSNPGVKAQFVPKNQARTEAVKARANQIKQDFKG